MTGQELRAWREAHRLSQLQFATIAHVGRDRVGAWEASDVCPLVAGFVVWCYDTRTDLLRQLDMLQAGTMQTSEKRPGATGPIGIDTTAATIERLEQQLTELDMVAAWPQPMADRIPIRNNPGNAGG